MSPHFGMMDLDKPWSISPDAKFPGAVARLTSNWLLGQKQAHDDYINGKKNLSVD